MIKAMKSFRGCWAPILAYIEQQFDAYLEGETRVQRVEVTNTIINIVISNIIKVTINIAIVIIVFTMYSQVPDSLVHACLYFIAPTGHGLKPLDIDFMRRIHNKVII